LDATPVSSRSRLVSTPHFSSAELFSFGFSSSEVGTIVLPARHIHAPAPHDQPTFDQHIFSSGNHQLRLFLQADRHWDVSFQFFHGRIGD
jgi:hypothetical protein